MHAVDLQNEAPRPRGGHPSRADDALARDLDRLATMTVEELRRRWRSAFGRAAPSGLPAFLLHRVLAYRAQELVLGSLDRTIARQLDGMRDGDSIPLPSLPLAKPGTLLVREWEGKLERVMVLDEGFAWNGTTYPSLSAVARAITGTSWNGPRFFGLREKRAR